MTKLILWDIDGTMVSHVGNKNDPYYSVRVGRFQGAVQEAFGVQAVFDPQLMSGMIDRQILWEMIKDKGVARADYEEKFPLMVLYMLEKLEEHPEVKASYQPVADAIALVKRIAREGKIRQAVITGNAESIAWWKLDAVGMRDYFPFGLFGDEVDDRNELAKRAFVKSYEKTGIHFAPSEIAVIGDTVYDIRCGKKISARTIAVTTGGTGEERLAAESPDLLVHSLADPRVAAFLGLAEPTGSTV